MAVTLKIVSLSVNHLTFEESIQQVIDLGLSYTASFVCFANVHMTIEAYRDPLFLQQLNKAAIITADGMPVAKACKWLYQKKQERIAGMDFMPLLLHSLKNTNAKIFLLGSTEEVLLKIKTKILSHYPLVEVVGVASPPFRNITAAEQQQLIDQINNTKPNFVFVSLGCPKQEKWMAAHSHQINAVLLGVGGAFPVFAGLQKRSPLWMQKSGLEWLYRLIQEPKRLFKRYFVTNTLFLFLLCRQKIAAYFKKNEFA